MAKTIGYSSQVITGQIVEAPHVSQSIEAFSAANQEDYDISISGSFKVSGSQFIKPNFLLTQTKPFVLSYDESTGQIFKMNTGSIIDVDDPGFAVYRTGSSDNNIIPAKFGNNLANADYAVVAGGQCNTASAAATFIGGGQNNTSSGACSFVGGGCNNKIQSGDTFSVIAGGKSNSMGSGCGFIGGGVENCIIGGSGGNAGGGVIVGGQCNQITTTTTGVTNTIVGGLGNCINATISAYSFIGGGTKNLILLGTGECSTVIVGGIQNTASGACSFIGGGQENTSSACYTFIGGGTCNNIEGKCSSIVGGTCNEIKRVGGNGAIQHNFIGGGSQNHICNHRLSVIAGGTTNMISGDPDTNFGRHFIGGGSSNQIDCMSNMTSIVGGLSNFISGSCAFIGGGGFNIARETGSAVVAGAHNTSSACHSFVGAGTFNFVSSSRAGVVAGCLNRIFSASDANAFIGGGRCNIIAGWETTGSTNSVIGGGACNKILAATASRDGNNFIGGGQDNIIQEFAINSSIVGGCGNCISGSGAGNSGVAGGVTSDNIIGAGIANKIRDEKGESKHNAILAGVANNIRQLTHTCQFPYHSSGENSIIGGASNCILARINHNNNFIAGGSTNKICFNRSAGIITGYFNCISGSFAGQGIHTGNIIGGGQCNEIRNSFKSGILTGTQNKISGSTTAAILGGYANRINSCPGGGQSTLTSAIVTGNTNLIKRSINSAIVGGTINQISGSLCSVIGGGYQNTIKSNPASSILGGCQNTMCTGTGFQNVITGGKNNKICANVCYAAIVNGFDNCVLHNGSAIIAASCKATAATDTLYVCNICVFGNQSVGGTKSFRIEHPDPSKSSTHELVHNSVESPTAGDTMYRFSITTENNEAEIILPEYYRYLNENTQLWVSADGHFGKAFGIVNLSATKIKITSNEDGKYNVMVVGTRKDKAAVASWKGAERLKK